MLRKGFTVEEVADDADLPMEEVARILEQLDVKE